MNKISYLIFVFLAFNTERTSADESLQEPIVGVHVKSVDESPQAPIIGVHVKDATCTIGKEGGVLEVTICNDSNVESYVFGFKIPDVEAVLDDDEKSDEAESLNSISSKSCSVTTIKEIEKRSITCLEKSVPIKVRSEFGEDVLIVDLNTKISEEQEP